MNPANPLIAKLKAIADNIDPQTDGIVVLIIGDIKLEFGITSTGNAQFDARRLATALEQAEPAPAHVRPQPSEPFKKR